MATRKQGGLSMVQIEERNKRKRAVAARFNTSGQDQAAGLGEWRRVTQPGGRVAFSVWGSSAFTPLLGLYQTRLRSYGIPIPERPMPPDAEAWRERLHEAGFDRISVFAEQHGYYL